MISFTTAKPDDLRAVLALLESNHLPTAGVKEHLETFILAFDGNHLVGCAGLEVYGKAGLLRSLAVNEAYRLQGLGKQLVKAILDLAEHQQLVSLSLLTTTARDYFSKFGFVEVSREVLPAGLKGSEELRGACPDSATAMMLELFVSM